MFVFDIPEWEVGRIFPSFEQVSGDMKPSPSYPQFPIVSCGKISSRTQSSDYQILVCFYCREHTSKTDVPVTTTMNLCLNFPYKQKFENRKTVRDICMNCLTCILFRLYLHILEISDRYPRVFSHTVLGVLGSKFGEIRRFFRCYRIWHCVALARLEECHHATAREYSSEQQTITDKNHLTATQDR